MSSRDLDRRTQRHFGSVVDRGGRMGPDGAGTTKRSYWGWDPDRAGLEEQRGPYWGKGPKGYQRNDERTRDDVCDAIAYQGNIDASDVEVKVESGVVTLSGTVALREEKRALERLVERCRGVHEVRNELRLARWGRPDGAREPTPTRSSPTPGSSTGHQRSKNARA